MCNEESIQKMLMDIKEEIIEHIDARIDELTRKFFSSLTKEEYSVNEVAERLGRSPWTVRQWCNCGQVPGAYKVGESREWRIPREALSRPLPGPAKSGAQADGN